MKSEEAERPADVCVTLRMSDFGMEDIVIYVTSTEENFLQRCFFLKNH